MLQSEFIFSVHRVFKSVLNNKCVSEWRKKICKVQTLARALVEQHTVPAFKELTGQGGEMGLRQMVCMKNA